MIRTVFQLSIDKFSWLSPFSGSHQWVTTHSFWPYSRFLHTIHWVHNASYSPFHISRSVLSHLFILFYVTQRRKTILLFKSSPSTTSSPFSAVFHSILRPPVPIKFHCQVQMNSAEMGRNVMSFFLPSTQSTSRSRSLQVHLLIWVKENTIEPDKQRQTEKCQGRLKYPVSNLF